MLVSISSECRSRPVFDIAASLVACAPVPAAFPFPLSAVSVPCSDETVGVADVVILDSDGSSKASELGASSGRVGKPS